MSSQTISDQLEDIFNVPKNGSNIKDDDESSETSYVEVEAVADNMSFDQKAQIINEKIAKDAPPVEASKGNPNPISTEVSSNVSKPTQPVEPAKPIASKNSFEEILSNSVSNKDTAKSPVLPVVLQQTINSENNKLAKESEDDDEVRSEPESVTSSNEIIYDQKPNDDGWLLTPPSPMYAHFYEQKSAFIRNITTNGRPIDIDKLTFELKNSFVRTNLDLTDLLGMSDRLTKVQDLLDRVVQIKIQATSQCSATKRGVELLRGVLAKVSYEKPAARQDGVIYDHMRDIEMYASRVESLEQASKDVYHNLLEAKEILSRKISIALELLKQQNITDGMERSFNNMPDNVKKIAMSPVAPKENTATKAALEGFDRLDVQEVVKAAPPKADKSIKKTGQSDWMD